MQHIAPNSQTGPTELLVTCPDCGTENFTAKGLRAHQGGDRCLQIQYDSIDDRASGGTGSGRVGVPPAAPGVSPGALALQPASASAIDSPDTILGHQLTEQYQRATGAILEIIIFGAMMLKLEQVVSTRGTNSPTRGPSAKGTGVKAWLKEFAPEISQPTAIRFRDIAEGLKKEFSLGAKVDLQQLLTTAPEHITDEKLRKKREKILEFIEGKSQRQLLLGFEKGEHGAGGGHDPAKNKKKDLTPEEEEALCLKACKDDVEALGRGVHHIGLKYTSPNITDAERDALVDGLRHLADEIAAYNATPKNKRTPHSGKQLLEGTAE